MADRTVYLAGGLKGGWRDRAIALFTPIHCVDARAWNPASKEDYTRNDLAAICACDTVVAYMDSGNPSGFGLCLEVGFAKALGKYIVFVDLLAGDPRSRYFDMCRVMADCVVGSLEEAARLLLGARG